MNDLARWVDHCSDWNIEELEILKEWLEGVNLAFSELKVEEAELEQGDADEATWHRHTMLANIAQGMMNMHAAGIYHLVEQQVIWLCQPVLGESGSYPTSLPAARTLLEHNGLDLGQVSGAALLFTELRLLANTAKHGEGTSANELKTHRPDFFFHPTYETIEDFGFSTPVLTPFAGRNLYVSAEQLMNYVDAAIGFWAEMGERFGENPAVQ